VAQVDDKQDLSIALPHPNRETMGFGQLVDHPFGGGDQWVA
jgi:hypothetical protein